MNSLKLFSNSIKLVEQFGDQGFTPPTEAYTEGANTNEGLISVLVNGLSNLIGILTIVAGLFFILNFFLGALGWVTAGDDTGKVDKAKTRLTNSAIGLIIVVASYGIIGLLSTLIGIDLINLGDTLELLNPNN